jgi:hypothetical protein
MRTDWICKRLPTEELAPPQALQILEKLAQGTNENPTGEPSRIAEMTAQLPVANARNESSTTSDRCEAPFCLQAMLTSVA